MKAFLCVMVVLLITLTGCGVIKVDVRVMSPAEATAEAGRSARESCPTIAPISPDTMFETRDGDLTETFDDPVLPGWELAGHTAIQNGVLRLESGDIASAHGAWDDLTLRVRVRPVGEGTVTINYRAKEGVAYRVVLSDEGVLLVRGHIEQPVELATAVVSVPTGEWFQFMVTVIDDQHVISINGETVLTVSDPDPLPPGGITLGATGLSYAEFDDFEVEETNDEP
jgi:hypothetical protein